MRARPALLPAGLLAACLAACLAAAPALAQAPAEPKPAAAPPPSAAAAPAAPALRIAPAAEAPAKPAAADFEMAELDARTIPLGGALRDDAQWQAWKARFMTAQGRVVDDANGMMSHSEGQGYGMLLAVAANDRPAFDALWGWTRANLMVRPDALVAWRWEPEKRSGVGDVNNATDGDLLIAWALAEAAEWWADGAYRVAARRLAVELARKTLLLKTKWGALILPAVDGFAAEDRPDGPVVNPSYWVYPALERLRLVAPEIDWKGVAQSGLVLLKDQRFGDARLPTDWVALKDDAPKPAEGFPATFGYNALRVPFYLAWAGVGERDHYAPFVAAFRAGPPAAVDVATGKGEPLADPGYRAIAALTLCAATGAAWPADLRAAGAPEHYYPATLRLLALLAAKMRYPACLGG